MNAAAISASTIHGTQRSDGELPPPVGAAFGRRRSPGGPSSGGRRWAGGRAVACRDATPAAEWAGDRWARRKAPVRRRRVRPRARDRSGGGSSWAGSSSSIAPCYGPAARPTEREDRMRARRSASRVNRRRAVHGFLAPPVGWPGCEQRPPAAASTAPAAAASAPSRRVDRRRSGRASPLGHRRRHRRIRRRPGRLGDRGGVRRRSRPPEPTRPRSWCSSARRTSPSSPGWPSWPGARAPARCARDFGSRSVGRRRVVRPTCPGFFARHRPAARRPDPDRPARELYGHTAKQDVVKTADRASGWQIPVLALAIVLLAPLTEELLFRGTLLRSLLRKVHARGGGVRERGGVRAGPRPGRPVGRHADRAARRSSSSAWCRATRPRRTGNLSRSILLHVGFNALSVVFLFTS